jgi:hypothetical protein
MDKQTNTPNDWRLLAERDMSVADHLANNMIPDMRLVLSHTKTIRDFLQKEIPGLFQ